jgi:fibro-slime domain-containing protein
MLSRRSLVLGLAAITVLAVTARGGEETPATISVTGILRDFPAAHPDFNVVPASGYGHYCGNVATELDADGKPVFTGDGFRVAREWRDSSGRQIAWCLYEESRDDLEGKGQPGDADPAAITSPETFAQWYRDVLGVNMSRPYTIEMARGSDGIYRYTTSEFLPIDGMMLDEGEDPHNYYFTFELVADFVYRAADQQMLEFMGDDDVWVFIDDKLVVDLGGIVGNANQYVDLDRLDLEDGQSYTLRFFMAERHQPKSQFHFETNILLDSSNRIPSVTLQFD